MKKEKNTMKYLYLIVGMLSCFIESNALTVKDLKTEC